MTLNDLIRKYALQNAAKFSGRANPGAVIGKLLQEDPELKAKVKELKNQVMKVIAEVQKLSVEDQLAELKKVAPELLEKKEKEEKDIFAFLGIKEGEKIITAFPPGPEKYPHIGHAKALLLNYLLAQRYKGRFYLRFEDTNPTLVKEEYYEIMLDNFKWLGVEWDELQYASDHMELFYRLADKLIKSGDAYVCTCNTETMRLNRAKGIACTCRDSGQESNIKAWKAYPTWDAGKAVLRLRIDLEHKNSTMRDPAIFRIIDEPHARLGKRYRVWPTYDFQNAVMDGHFKVTHRLRSKEFEMRNELQRYIQKLAGFKETSIYEFARFNLKGVLSSGRAIRQKIEDKELMGWDDPSLTTLVALRRRGFTPEAVKDFVVATGITKSEATLTWGDLIVQNRRLLDKECDRYFFVRDPVKIVIDGAPEQKLRLKKHPELEEKGTRELKAGSDFFLTKSDLASLEDGALYRLMDCLNFTRKGKTYAFHSREYEKFKRSGKKIMHYLPASDDLVQVEVLMPDHSVAKGLAEQGIKRLKPGSQIQFERFGFVRLDSVEKGKYCFWYTHQ
jgi:glutamyl-tRNA synthetase